MKIMYKDCFVNNKDGVMVCYFFLHTCDLLRRKNTRPLNKKNKSLIRNLICVMKTIKSYDCEGLWESGPKLTSVTSFNELLRPFTIIFFRQHFMLLKNSLPKITKFNTIFTIFGLSELPAIDAAHFGHAECIQFREYWRFQSLPPTNVTQTFFRPKKWQFCLTRSRKKFNSYTNCFLLLSNSLCSCHHTKLLGWLWTKNKGKKRNIS